MSENLRAHVDVSLATGDFAQNVSELAASDVGKNLSQALSGLADIQRKAQDFQNVQSEQDITTLNGTGACQDYLPCPYPNKVA